MPLGRIIQKKVTRDSGPSLTDMQLDISKGLRRRKLIVCCKCLNKDAEMGRRTQRPLCVECFRLETYGPAWRKFFYSD